MPASRIILGLAVPVVGIVAAWLISLAAGQNYSIFEYEAALLGAWLVTVLGGWIKARLEHGLQARVAVIGPREFAADFAAELVGRQRRHLRRRRLDRLARPGRVPATCAGSARLDASALGGPLRAHRPDRPRPAADRPGGGPARTSSPSVADECVDLPVRLIAANQLYEEVLGHVPVGMIDAAWYRYIMHPRFRASGPHSKRAFDLVFGTHHRAASSCR